MSVEPDEADATYFDRLGQGLMHRIWRENPSTVDTRRFRSFFGTSPDVCSTLWRRLYPTMSQPGFATKHLLWALNFMKCYQTEAVASSAVAQCDEKTLRKWVWIFVESIGNLQRQVIVWENRYINDIGNDCLISVDGTDFRIMEPAPLSKSNYSFKFHGPGFRYEVALCIRTGDIVWINGPFQPGDNTDLVIFQEQLVHKLDAFERVEADDGYKSMCPRYVKTQELGQSAQQVKMRSDVLARHEHVNARFESWNALSTTFRHNKNREYKHGLVFTAAAVVIQISFSHGEPLDPVNYVDN